MAHDLADIRGLTAAIASGSTEAFAVFYEGWFDRAYRSIRKMTGFDESTCLDVVQDAMLKAATSMPRLRDESQLSAWLNRVMLNVARDRIRSEMRRSRREEAVQPVHAERAAPEDLEALAMHLDTLESEQQALLHARFSLGWTLHRIADSVGLGAGAVDGRIKRALNQLRDEFTDDSEGSTS